MPPNTMFRAAAQPFRLQGSRMSSTSFRRVLQYFMKPAYFIGRDLEGNKYYEYPNTNNGRPKRNVQYKRGDDMWAYIASGKRLPVQWNAWLTHTRSDPPSIDELKADLERQHRVQMNAATLDARDKEERESTVWLAHPLDSHPRVPEPRSEKAPEQTLNEPPIRTRSDGASPSPIRDPWAEIERGPDDPQSWTPVVGRK